MNVTYSFKEVCEILCQQAGNKNGEHGKFYSPNIDVQVPILGEGKVQFEDIVFTVKLGEPRDAP